MCITGDWGVGKTFAWKRYLAEAQRDGTIALQKYAYVSLFGLTSLDDVRAAIVENALDSRIVDGRPDFTSIAAIGNRLVDGFKHTAGELTKYARFLPVGVNYALSAGRVLYALVSEQIVCIDDLERAGSGISVKSVMGLVSSLKEEKKSKVVLLLNQNALEGDSASKYKESLEKVADVVLHFAPSAKEAAEIGVDTNLPYADQIRQDVETLNIVNIRTIKKIERNCYQIFSVIRPADVRLQRQIIKAVSLAVYSKFQPEVAPPWGFIMSFNSIVWSMRSKDRDTSVEEEGYAKKLRNFDFWHADDLDNLIFDVIDQGYLDKSTADRVLEAADKKQNLADQAESFHSAWSLYNRSFSVDEDTLFQRLNESFRTNVAALSPGDLSGTVEFFKEFGREDEAIALITFYTESRDEQREFWDLFSGTGHMMVSDSDVRSAFADKYGKMRKEMSLVEALRKMSSDDGYSESALEILASASASDFAEVFKQADADDFPRLLGAAVKFARVSNPTEPMAALNRTVSEALDQIAAENRLNARRVAMLRKSR